MPECNYCDGSFEGEGAYLEHLHAEHDESELSRIDRRRVADHVGDDEAGEFPTGPVIIAGTLLFTVAVLVYVVFVLNVGGGSGPAAASGSVGEVEQTPYGYQSGVHQHGSIDVVVDGNALDFSQEQYQLRDDAFHFENGNGQQWHKHAQGVTLEYAMSTLGIGVTDSSVTFQGTTYNESDANTNVTVAVNGNDVDPSSYVLQDGDSIRVVAESS
jgi:hypothetical protein